MPDEVDIFFFTNSKGLAVDAKILQLAIGPERSKIFPIPRQARFEPASTNELTIKLNSNAKTAIFVQNLFEHPIIANYTNRVLLANPEWLTNRDKHMASQTITEFWHKSHWAMDLLMRIFPSKLHTYIGFTSLRNPSSAIDYNHFSHFPGKSKTRHTQDIINIWLKNPELPSLKIQAYNFDISLPFWLEKNNLSLFLGFLEEKDYISEYSKNGIHICTSQMEGFGHYINEARSIGALVITLDAPPMNELIDSNSGILVPTEKTISHHHGKRFIASPDAIEKAILEASRMPIATRKKLGENARSRFLNERRHFVAKIRSIISSYHNQDLTNSQAIEDATRSSKRKNLFSSIYKNDAWGGKIINTTDYFYSGSGSREPRIVSPYINAIHSFLKMFPEKPNVVDLGCGDFYVGSKIRSMCKKYIACDIVTELIEYNRNKFQSMDVDFRILDIVCDHYPSGEVVFLRQVLQHISNSDIKEVAKKISDKYKYLILSEHIPSTQNFRHNMDKPSGSDIRLKLGSGVVLTSFPFNLNVLHERILCEVEEYGGIIRTILYKLKD